MITSPSVLRIVFAGTPDFAVPTLAALQASKHRICAVYTQPDRQAGRGRRPRASPVKQQAHGLPVYQPSSLRSPVVKADLAELAPDLMIVVAYGLILPKDILRIPRLGCINVHASLLPRWRGAAPIQRALLAGDSETGVSIMQMDEGLDSGPVLGTAAYSIEPGTTAGELHDRLAALGAQTLLNLLPELIASNLVPQPQDETRASYAPKLSKSEAILDWSQSAITLERQILAFNPWPVAQTTAGQQILRVWHARARAESSSAAPGTVLAQDRNSIDIATGRGILQLTKIQLPGKRPMAVADFLNAHSLAGTILGGS